MPRIYDKLSRTFSEFLLLPNLTDENCIPENVSLRAPLCRFTKEEGQSRMYLNIPFVSAIMQAVSDDGMAIALARQGGMSFIFGSQPVDSQAAMVSRVKRYKAGFVVSDANLKPSDTVNELAALKAKTGHSTVAVTDDGSAEGILLGLVTSRDYRQSRMGNDVKISEIMTHKEDLVIANEGITLKEANDIIWDKKINQLPIINEEGRLTALVFRKDYDEHREYPAELLDSHKRLICGAGINSRDYKERVPALLEAGADAFCIDSSDGFSVWQRDTIKWIKENHGNDVPVGAGNVVDAEGFEYLADAGADFIKVGIGGGSICITREQKGIGCGQASAVMAVAEARDRYYARTGHYIPVCSDGGIVYDYHMALALAMGADFMMLGRYFARFDESPGKRVILNGGYFKEYWGEGSNRARNWQRYNEGGEQGKMHFEEGVDSYVPYAGSLKDNLPNTIAKIKATMVSCGSIDIEKFRKSARMVVVSPTSIVEGGAHDVIRKENERS